MEMDKAMEAGTELSLIFQSKKENIWFYEEFNSSTLLTLMSTSIHGVKS